MHAAYLSVEKHYTTVEWTTKGGFPRSVRAIVFTLWLWSLAWLHDCLCVCYTRTSCFLTRSVKHIVTGILKYNKLRSALSNPIHQTGSKHTQLLFKNSESVTDWTVFMRCIFLNYRLQWAEPGPAFTMMEMNDIQLRVGKLWMMMMKEFLSYCYCVVALTHSGGSPQYTGFGSVHSWPVDVRIRFMMDQDNLQVCTYLSPQLPQGGSGARDYPITL